MSKRATQLVTELMAISGASGDEAEVAAYLRRQLKDAGVSSSLICHDWAHRRAPIRGTNGNLIVKLPGTIRRPRRLLMAHMDTVPICTGARPVRRGRFLTSAVANRGIGADDRAGVAVVLYAVLEIFRRRLPHPPLTLLWTVQEETGLHGARLVNRSMLGHPRLAFNWDGGSASKLTIGATSGYRLEVTIGGKASHAGGAPEKGISAIAIASLAVARLHQEGWHGNVVRDGQHGTSNVGIISGGHATNVVADRVVVRAEARSHDAAFRERIVEQMKQTFAWAASQVRNDAGETGDVHVQGRLDYDAFCLSRDEACVCVAAKAVRGVGREPELAVANGGLDANWMSAHGIPTVSLGCGQLHQHTTAESLDLHEFRDACAIAKRIATGTEKST